MPFWWSRLRPEGITARWIRIIMNIPFNLHHLDARKVHTHFPKKNTHLFAAEKKKVPNLSIFSNPPKKKNGPKKGHFLGPLESVLSIVLAISKEPSSLPPAIHQVLLKWSISVIKVLDCMIIPRGIGYSMLCKTIKRTYQGQYIVIFMHIHFKMNNSYEFLLQFHFRKLQVP